MRNGRPGDIGAGFGGVVLAAGRGSRMGADIPKVMLKVGGTPMVRRVVETLRDAGVSPVCVIVPAGSSPVRELLGDTVLYAVQERPTGTGDATAAARPLLTGSSRVVVACGDSPLFSVDTVRRLMDAHCIADAPVTLVTAHLDDPSGYGRIVRDSAGTIVSVVEESVAHAREKAISEVNGGLYAFNASWLWDNIQRPAADEREFVLTEVVARAVAQGRTVSSAHCEPGELAGVNTPAQLEEASRILMERSRSPRPERK